MAAERALRDRDQPTRAPFAPRRGSASSPQDSYLLALQASAGNRGVIALLARSTVVGAAPATDAVQRVGTIISAPPLAGTSVHVTLRKSPDNDTVAVKELQQKLSTSLGGMAWTLSWDGIFGNRTESYVKDFQKKFKLAETGVVDAATWDLLDAQGKSSVGRVDRGWEQTLIEGGSNVTYGMTSKYSYNIDSKKIVISVGINFVADVDHPPADLSKVVKKWTDRILGRWNLYKAQRSDGKDSRDIVFQIVPTGGNTVTVTNENVGSDAGTWSVPDNENDNGPAHEFGHMIGLQDEYKRTMADYKSLHPGMEQTEVDKAKGESYGGDQYSNKTSMMGMGALSAHDDKGADPEPRHVREFVGYVEKYLGGTWETKAK